MSMSSRKIMLILGLIVCLAIVITSFVTYPTVSVASISVEVDDTANNESSDFSEDEWPYSISKEEVELIALVAMAEAEGETELGQRLVIDTILNRVDSPNFPDSVVEVIYQPNQFTSMWNGRVDRCYVTEEFVNLVKEELLKRTNHECVFFTAGDYGEYGVPMFKECCHYFSSYD